MKKMIALAFLSLIVNTFSFANPFSVFSEKTENFLKERNSLKEDKAFLVMIDESSNKTYLDLIDKLKRNYRVMETKNGSLKIKNENVKVDLSEFSSHKVEFVRGMLKEIMPEEYANQFMLFSIDTDRSFSVSQGSKIEGYTFNFKRVFNNRVVRNKKNYLTIRVNGDGRLKNAEIAMQDLIVGTESIAIGSNLEEKKAALDSLLKADYDFLNFVGENGKAERKKVEKIDASSAAEAYCEVDNGEKRILFPCLSYTSRMTLSDGDEISLVVDSPCSLKSWRDYHEKNMSSRFIRYSR